jgi:hypothetical protein
LHAPALDRRAGPVRAAGIDVPLGVAVVARVGVDQDPLRPSFLGVADLQASEKLAVACQDDLVPDLDAHLFEGVEILGPRVVGVNHLAFHVSRDAITVEREGGGPAHRVLVGLDGVLEDLEDLLGRLRELQARGGQLPQR